MGDVEKSQIGSAEEILKKATFSFKASQLAERVQRLDFFFLPIFKFFLKKELSNISNVFVECINSISNEGKSSLHNLAKKYWFFLV